VIAERVVTVMLNVAAAAFAWATLGNAGTKRIAFGPGQTG
jgi:hypothetical protein